MLIDPVSDCCGATVTIYKNDYDNYEECDFCEEDCIPTRFNTTYHVEVG